jgi:psp operon transcriptional activator
VRGLKNTVERSVYRSEDPDEKISRIVFDPFEASYHSVAAEAPTPGEEHQAPEPRPPSINLPTDLKDQVATLEKKLIGQAMQASRYRQPQAAELLGLTYNQLRAMLRKYGLVERYGRARGKGV